jgi:hypothetical protein
MKKKTRKALEAANVALYNIIDDNIIECNCGSVCEGTCSQALCVRALGKVSAVLNDKHDLPRPT